MNEKRPRSGMPASVKTARTFKGVPERVLARIFESATSRQYPPQSWIYRQGQPARNFFLLESGLVSLSEVTTSGYETLLRFIYPGDPMGFVAVAGIDDYVLSAQVLRTSKVWTWNREAAHRLLHENPNAAANLLSITIQDVIYYYHHIRRLRMDPLERRIDWSLLQLSRAVGRSTPAGTLIETGGYRQLAELAGTNIYSVSRQLSKLECRGIVTKSHGRIVLLAPKRLQESIAHQS